MRLTGYVAAIALLAVAPLAAQSKGTFEIGGFGRYTDYTNAYLIRGPDDNRIGGGGRIGSLIGNTPALDLPYRRKSLSSVATSRMVHLRAQAVIPTSIGNWLLAHFQVRFNGFWW